MANEENLTLREQYALLDRWQPELTKAKDGANVSPAVLSSVLRQIHSRLIGSGVCFESQETMAGSLKLNPKTVNRAVDALVQIGVITLQRKCRPGGKRPLNHHTMCWSAVRKLVPIDQPVEIEQTDMVSDQTDMVSGTNGHGVRNKRTQCPEQTDMVSRTNGHSVRGTTIEPTIEQPTSTPIEKLNPEWEEVVKEVRDCFGVHSAPTAVRAAKARGLTIGGIRFILSKCNKATPGITCNALKNAPEKGGLYGADEANAAWKQMQLEADHDKIRIAEGIRSRQLQVADLDRKAGKDVNDLHTLAMIFRHLQGQGLSEFATEAERDAPAAWSIAAATLQVQKRETPPPEWKHRKKEIKSKSATVACTEIGG